MCSNTSSTSGGDDDYATHILKKPKRQRVPKRGPGVAELEKILREKETKVIVNAHKGNVPFVLDHYNINHFSPPPPPPNKSTFSVSRGNGESNGVRIVRSDIVLPEEALFATMWNSCESSIYEEVPKMPSGYPISTSFVNVSDQMHMLNQNKQYSHQYPSPMINLFPQSESLTSPEKQSAAGFYVHIIEPPSNQRSYSSMLAEEEHMVGTKRPRNFSAPPIFHYQASSFFNLQRDKALSRDYGAMNGNYLIFGSPATPSSLMTQNSQQEFSYYRSFPFQKPCYSFLIPEEQTRRREEETTISLNNERPRDTIDLNLKL